MSTDECEALVALYDSTNGASWTNSTGWLTGTTPCDWYGVTCEYDHVTLVVLSGNNLSGTLPDLSGLSGLYYLYLNGNALTGSIPASLGNLTNLLELYLNNNQLSGSIPSELGNLTGLNYLYLSENDLTGSIPSSFGNLTNLLNLSLYDNQLSGSIPSGMAALTNLRSLDLSKNQFSGSIPTWIDDYASLAVLDLSTNAFSGTIPTELGNLSNLSYLSLSGNDLTGSIPTSLGNLSNLSALYLGDNQLSGSIPSQLGSLTALEYLYLNGNALTGSIPASLGNLSNLVYLYLQENQLSGSIPSSLSGLTNVQYLSLSDNDLTGSIPTSLGSLSSLLTLTISNNQLSGTVPAELGNLTALNVLNIRYNGLSGSLPEALTNLVNLNTFYYDGTSICTPTSTTFQTWLAGIADLLRTLDCGGAPIQVIAIAPSGSIDNWSPTFSWFKTSDTDSYELYIYQETDAVTVILDQEYAYADANCDDDNVCEITPDISLADGQYSWIVRGINEVGEGNYSFVLSFTTPDAPAQITAVSPSGEIATYSPTFTWNKSTLAQSYQLYIYQTDGSTTTDILNQSYTAAEAACGSATCSVTPALTLSAGEYFWEVRGSNPSGDGAWSATLSFTIPEVPGLVTPVSPIGSITTWSPSFTWNVEANSDSYQVYVYKTSGSTTTDILNQTYTSAEAACGSTTCTVNPGLSLGAGPYTWTIRGINIIATGDWSDPKTFNTPSVPGQITAVTPTGEIGTYSPTFTWNKSTLAQSYQLYIYQVDGSTTTDILKQWYTSAEAACGDTTCSITPSLTLSAGDYFWKVQGKNPSGEGTWSTALSFTVPEVPAAITLVSPTGEVNTYSPTFTWNVEANSGSYQLYVYQTVGSTTTDIFNHTYTSAEAACGATTCSVTPSLTLSAGEYFWKVRGSNIIATGNWSSVLSFIVPEVPGAITLVSPIGEIDNWSPSFTWNVEANSDSYQLYVYQTDGSTTTDIFQQWYTSAEAACGATTCTVNPALSLSGGTFYWKMRGKNNIATGQWSGAQTFDTPIIPELVTLIAPQGDIKTMSPTYRWSKEDVSDSYQLYVYQTDGSTTTDILKQWYTSAEAGCDDNVCEVTPDLTLASGVFYWTVAGKSEDGTGEFNTALSFTTPSIPGTATLIAPTGTSKSWSPAYSWNEVASAESYELYIYQTDGTTTTDIFKQWYTAEEANCSDDGICKIDPDLNLPIGQYSWTVAGKNAAGTGQYSAALIFNTPATPGPITLHSPVGTSDSWTPTFTWVADPAIQSYQLFIYKVSGSTATVIHKVWYTAEAAACIESTCSVTPDITLGGGMYYWKVRGKNLSGTGAWSTAATFNTPAKPEKIVTSTPTGTITTWTPTFTWNKDALAQSYVLYIYKKSGTTVTQVHMGTYTSEAANCDDDGICEITPAITLGGGKHYWSVRGKNPSGKGAWSDALTLTTPAVPGQIDTIAPLETSGNWTPTFNWNVDALAQSYQLYIYKKSGTTVTTVLSKWYPAEEAACDATACSVTPEITLGGGKYYWKVRGRNPSGKGAWSEVLTFSTPAAPGQVTLINPGETSGSAVPELRWNVEASSQEYLVYIYKKSGTKIIDVYKEWHTAEDVHCDSGECYITPDVTLDAGTYYWKVRGMNPSGKGAWSDVLSFTIVAP